MAAATRAEKTFEQTLATLACDLRSFVATLQRPQREPHGTKLQWARERCHELAERVAELRQSAASRRDALPGALNDLRASLQGAATELGNGPRAEKLAEWRASLVRAYEDFVARVREAKVRIDAAEELRDIRVPRLARSALHVAIGVGCVLLYELLLDRSQALMVLGSFVSLFAFLEISRRLSSRWNDFMVDRVFGYISRPRERYKVNSASYYLLALTVIVFIAPPAAVSVACLVLGLGDPIASAIGHRWGTRRIYHDKSLQGSLAFFVTAAAAVFAYGLLAQPGWGLLFGAGVAALAALVGTVTELFSDRIDDNFSIPVVTTLVMMLIV